MRPALAEPLRGGIVKIHPVIESHRVIA